MAETSGLGKPSTPRHIKPMSQSPPNTPKSDKQPRGTRTPTPPQAPNESPTGEIGGPEGPEPTRYGDWEVGGRCTDF
jgi:hypothetical protein